MRWLIYLVIFLLGALLFSQAIVMMDLDPLPGDIDIKNWHIHIPVLYSLGASGVLALLIWFFRR